VARWLLTAAEDLKQADDGRFAFGLEAAAQNFLSILFPGSATL